MQRNRGKQQNGKDQRSLQENQRYQRNISCKGGHNKGQRQHGPNKSKDFKKTWQEYTEELNKKGLSDPDKHNGVIIHLQPDILECEVKWALRSITMNKPSEGAGIELSYFKSQKMLLFKCCIHYASKFGKLSSVTGLEKVGFQSSFLSSYGLDKLEPLF